MTRPSGADVRRGWSIFEKKAEMREDGALVGLAWAPKISFVKNVHFWSLRSTHPEISIRTFTRSPSRVMSRVSQPCEQINHRFNQNHRFRSFRADTQNGCH